MGDAKPYLRVLLIFCLCQSSGSFLYVYIHSSSVTEGDKDNVAIFYTLVIPLLYPFIYSL